MNRDELAERQRPLKALYRATPGAALVTLRAEGALAADDATCTVRTDQGPVVAGLHAAAGGDGASACSGDMLLQALVACTGVTLRAVAIAKGMDVTGTVRAEGDLDFRGTLGTDRDAPVGFRAVRVVLALRSTAPEERLRSLVATTERYCVVLQTLVATPELTVTLEAG